MPDLLIASTNPGKLREIQDILGNLPGWHSNQLRLLQPADLGLHLVVQEDGQTYAENAALKARAYCHTGQKVTLADDSGLEVDALGGQPGLHSARYAPLPGATDADRRAYLLHNLKDHPRPWPARFRCTVCISTPAGELYYTEGVCPGEIIDQERGRNGFGYDPIFLLPELGRTMAELNMSEKNRLSHRARAVQAALPLLEKIFKERD
ncbi:MAG: RdgB/HAM1 family non-canonical purine NTP pyrophosphatase [Anaerolineaceae bacterium]|nr:RdgB/HAM1 family non-canonical purine NTP pyrophosphatase [Anaerolineaceae bacterium]